MREHKIGEIFEYNGEWYQCLESSSCRCDYCDYGESGDCHKIACTSGERSDDKEVYFKKLEKIGEPYGFQKRTFQTYRLHTIPFLSEDVELVVIPSKDNNTIEIEIKQNKKEDMGIDKVVMNIDDRDYLLDRLEAILHDTHCQQYKDEICEAFSKYIVTENVSNSKPFNLEEAKAGKPVCTRDGRKARIICFDRVDAKPILALVASTDGKGENVFDYFVSGKRIASALESDLDLMMSLEKKEGWANIYKSGECYNVGDFSFSKEEIEQHKNQNNYIATVKISWEE